MKIQTAKLLQVLSTLMKVVPAKSALPHTQYVRLSFIPEGLHLWCTDADTSITVTVPPEERTEPDDTVWCVPARTLFEIIKAVQSEAVELAAKDSKEFLIKWENGRASLPLMEDCFETITPGPDADSFLIPADTFSEAVGEIGFAVGDDEFRPALRNLLFNFSEDAIEVVASDSQVLMCHRTGMKCDAGLFLLPDRIASIIKGIPASGVIQFLVETNKASALVGPFRLDFRPGFGKYPAYRPLFPTSVSSTLRVDVKTLLQSVKRMAVCDPCIRMHIESDLTGGSITVSSANKNFRSRSTETLPCVWDGEPTDTAFKASTLIDILANTGFQGVRLGFTGPRRAVVVCEDSDGGKIQGILMPVAA